MDEVFIKICIKKIATKFLHHKKTVNNLLEFDYPNSNSSKSVYSDSEISMVVLDSAISLVDSGSAISLVESAAGFRAWIIKGWVADCDTLVVSFSWCKIIIDNFLVFCHKGRSIYNYPII